MSEKPTISHRKVKIRQIGRKFHAYVDGVERAYPDQASAKFAIDEMKERREHVERQYGSSRSHPYEDAKMQFFTFQEVRGRSAVTLRNYQTFFAQLEKVTKIKTTGEITVELITKYLSRYQVQNTKHTNFNNARGFVRFCLGKNYLIDGKILKMGISAGNVTKGKRMISEDELKVCTEWWDKRKTDLKLLWMVGMQIGVRTGETVRLLRKDFDAQKRTITIYSPKNKKTKILEITEELSQLLQRHMAIHQSEYLVSHKGGKRYSEGAITSMVRRMRDDLKMPADIAFYSLRKRASTIAVEVGGSAFEAKALGHTAETALAHYITVDPLTVRKFLARTSVIGGPKDVPTVTPEGMTRESVEKYLLEIAKTDRDWVKGVLMKAI
jgi:integrase